MGFGLVGPEGYVVVPGDLLSGSILTLELRMGFVLLLGGWCRVAWKFGSCSG